MVPEARKTLLQPARLSVRPRMDTALRADGCLLLYSREARGRGRREDRTARLFRGAAGAERAVDVRVLWAQVTGLGARGNNVSPFRRSSNRLVILEGLEDGGVAALAVPVVDRLRDGLELLDLAPEQLARRLRAAPHGMRVRSSSFFPFGGGLQVTLRLSPPRAPRTRKARAISTIPNSSA